MRLPNGPNETPTNLYNPTKEDFTCKWEGKDYTIPSRQLVTHPKWLADHIAKHLAQKIALEDDRGLAYEYRLKEAMDKIIVTI